MEGLAASTGRTLSAEFRRKVQVGPVATDCWFSGIQLPFTEEPPLVALPDNPSVVGDRERAAM